MKRAILAIALSALYMSVLPAQIVNRLNVKDNIFQRYAYGKMQPYSPANIVLADSIYLVGAARGDIKLKSLALSLELSARYAMNEYERMDSIVSELKALAGGHTDMSEFYFSVIYEYCQLLMFQERASDAMLEARFMQRKKSPARWGACMHTRL